MRAWSIPTAGRTLKIKTANFDGAIADADAAMQLNPRVPWHYATRGQANEDKGDFAAAARDCSGVAFNRLTFENIRSHTQYDGDFGLGQRRLG